ncbi:MAG TPA: hypothetical protein PK598_16310 [Thermoanaerobaculia bacterium]|nr:hypothetical protein [Thermoanaerobaculia bacterium]
MSSDSAPSSALPRTASSTPGRRLEDMFRRTAGWAEVLTLLKFHVELGARY